MKSILKTFLILTILLLSASLASAADYSVRFSDIDLDADGYISWPEYKSYYPQATRAAYEEYLRGGESIDIDAWRYYRRKNLYDGPVYAARFRDIDVNRDGLIYWDEFKGYYPYSTKVIFMEISRGRNFIDYDSWLVYRDKYGFTHTAYYGRFREVDLDGDGVITWAEFKAYYPTARREDYFAAIGTSPSMDYYRWRYYGERYGYGPVDPGKEGKIKQKLQ